MSKNLHPQIIEFFRARMDEHSTVDSWRDDSTEDFILYRIQRKGDMPSVLVLLSDAYSFSRAECLAIPASLLQRIHYILVADPHGDYTTAAEQEAKSRRIGIGKLRDFMSALTRSDVSSARPKQYRDE